MSRSVLRNTVFGIATLALSSVAFGQEAKPLATAETIFANADEAYSTPAPDTRCKAQDEDEIVVCAITQEQSQFRVKSSAELDPTSEEAIDDAVPRAPDFAAPPCEPNLLTVCPKLGKIVEPALIIDVAALPEAPAGSDASKIAAGQEPAQ